MGPRDEPAAIGVADLAAGLARSERTVREVLRRLAATGWLVVQRTGRQGLLAAVVSTAEHIETGEKLPLRPAETCRSDRQKPAAQTGRNLPVAPPPPIHPPVCGGETGREGEREATAPPPPAARVVETTTAAGRAGGIEDLAAEFRQRQVTPEPLEAIMAVLAEDLALKRYRLDDLRLVIESLPAIDARAWRLRERVPALAAAVRGERMRDRLRTIHAEVLTSAWRRSAPSRRATVERVDVAGGRLVLVEWQDGCRGDRLVIERLEDLDCWAFGLAEPTLFPLGDGPPPAGNGPTPQSHPVVRLPEQLEARVAAERLLAAVGHATYATWFQGVGWQVDGSVVAIHPPNQFLADYLRSHFLPALTAAGIQLHARVGTPTEGGRK
jgi:hypothetical protein